MLRVNNLSGFGRIIPAAGGFDSDAQAFFTATSISDSTIQDAIDALVVGLKADSIWTKCSAIYPFVGGSSSTHAVNLKSPGTHDITWNGTVTHNANGITGNGSTGYGDTGLNLSSVLSNANVHYSIYSRTSGAANLYDMGARGGATSDYTLMLRQGDNTVYGPAGNQGTFISYNNSAGASGFYVITRRSTTELEFYKNGSSVQTVTTSDTGTVPSRNVYISARNNAGTADNFSSRNIAFVSIGPALSDTEAGNFNTRVETFQDALSRGVV
jgi:hypothetical protein